VDTGRIADVTHADMDIHNEFIAYEKDLVFYAGKPVLNRVHTFYDVDRNPWSFTDALSYTFKIWEEREGGLLMISWSDPNNLSNSGNDIILNAPAEDTDIERGKYYYEIEYTVAGGYPVLIAYGKAQFI
jgi:hypothetical protein